MSRKHVFPEDIQSDKVSEGHLSTAPEKDRKHGSLVHSRMSVRKTRPASATACPPCTSCPHRWSRNVLPTTRRYSPGSSPHSPYYNSSRSLVDCDNSRNRGAGGGRMFFSGGGRVLYLVSLSGTTEAVETQMGRLDQGSNIRPETAIRSKDFPPVDNHVSGG